MAVIDSLNGDIRMYAGSLHGSTCPTAKFLMGLSYLAGVSRVGWMFKPGHVVSAGGLSQ